MSVTHRKTSELEAKLEIKVSPEEDLKPRVEGALKQLRKNADFKGFRKGAVPMSFIRKRYEQGVKLDELNKIVSEKMNDYLKAENLKLIAEPLPVPQEDFDLEANEFTFEFDLGFYPEFEPSFEALKLEQKLITPDKKTFDESFERALEYHREKLDADRILEDGVFAFEYELPKSEGDDQEPDEKNLGMIEVEVKHLQKPDDFLGKTHDDVVEFKLSELVVEDQLERLQRDLGLSLDEWEEQKDLPLKGNIQEIYAFEKPEINAEFYNKVLNREDIETEEQFNEEFSKLIVSEYQYMADQELVSQFFEQYHETNKPEIPENFIKKIIEGENKDKAEDSIHEAKELENLKKEIVNNRLFEKFDLRPTTDEIRENLRQRLEAIPGYSQLGEQFLDQMVDYTLKDENSFNQEYERGMFQRLLDFIKKEIKIDQKEMDLDKFIEELKEKNKESEEVAEAQSETEETN